VPVDAVTRSPPIKKTHHHLSRCSHKELQTAVRPAAQRLGSTSRRSQPPLALAVPLSRFTSRVGGGSAFFVRCHLCAMHLCYGCFIRHHFCRCFCILPHLGFGVVSDSADRGIMGIFAKIEDWTLIALRHFLEISLLVWQRW